MTDLIPAHRKALRNLLNSDYRVIVGGTVSPYVVKPIRPGMELREGDSCVRVDAVSVPAFQKLRSEGYVEFDKEKGLQKIRVTPKGFDAMYSPIRIERPEPSPSASRPCIARFIGEEQGAIHVHVRLEDKALWLFIQGPAGGDRGEIAVSPNRADELLTWIADVHSTTIPFGKYRPLGAGWGLTSLSFRRTALSAGACWAEARRRGSFGAPWKMRFDPEGATAFLDCLRAWAAKVKEEVPA